MSAVEKPEEAKCLHTSWEVETGPIARCGGDAYSYWYKCASCKTTVASFYYSDHTAELRSFDAEWAARTNFNPQTMDFDAKK
jgi:hypothetical protein